jgi:hypothetical protein
VKVDEIKNINKHFNLAHFGVNVLSMSKRIMNEVFCLAEDNGIEMFYQDTDSCHMLFDDVSRLTELFKGKYGRELIGKNLGQFHSDCISMMAQSLSLLNPFSVERKCIWICFRMKMNYLHITVV